MSISIRDADFEVAEISDGSHVDYATLPNGSYWKDEDAIFGNYGDWRLVKERDSGVNESLESKGYYDIERYTLGEIEKIERAFHNALSDTQWNIAKYWTSYFLNIVENHGKKLADGTYAAGKKRPFPPLAMSQSEIRRARDNADELASQTYTKGREIISDRLCKVMGLNPDTRAIARADNGTVTVDKVGEHGKVAAQAIEHASSYDINVAMAQAAKTITRRWLGYSRSIAATIGTREESGDRAFDLHTYENGKGGFTNATVMEPAENRDAIDSTLQVLSFADTFRGKSTKAARKIMGALERSQNLICQHNPPCRATDKPLTNSEMATLSRWRKGINDTRTLAPIDDTLLPTNGPVNKRKNAAHRRFVSGLNVTQQSKRDAGISAMNKRKDTATNKAILMNATTGEIRTAIAQLKARNLIA